MKEADAFPESYEKQFGPKVVELPSEGGQWGHYHACPQTGRQLVFSPPNHNVCPDTGQEFSGYPYDQVVYTMRANALGSAPRRSGTWALRQTGRGDLRLWRNAEHTFDWVYHNFGRQEIPLAAEPWSGFAAHDGYQHLTDNHVSNHVADWQDVFRISATDRLARRGMHLWMLPDIASRGTPALRTQVVNGFGLGQDLRIPVPYVLARRRGRSTQFVALMEPSSEQPLVRGFARVSDNSEPGSRYAIMGFGWKDIVTVGDTIAIEHRKSR